MDKITIWCYDCGTMWFDRTVRELYDYFVRCPHTGCDGMTDGLKQ